MAAHPSPSEPSIGNEHPQLENLTNKISEFFYSGPKPAQDWFKPIVAADALAKSRNKNQFADENVVCYTAAEQDRQSGDRVAILPACHPTIQPTNLPAQSCSTIYYSSFPGSSGIQKASLTNLNIEDGLRDEVARLLEDQVKGVATRKLLRHVIAEQVRAGTSRLKELEMVKKELAQAQGDLMRLRSLAGGPSSSSTRLSPQTTPHLLPHDLQELDPLVDGFTCIGTTSPGKRCGQKSLPLLALAFEELSIMRTHSSYRRDLASLESLASSLMCTRWHARDALFPQYHETAAQWLEELSSTKTVDYVEAVCTGPVLKDPVTPVRSTFAGFPHTPLLSPSASHSSASSASSDLSTEALKSSLMAATALDSPLARKSEQSILNNCSCMKRSDGTGYGWCASC